MNMDSAQITLFAESLLNVKNNIKRCKLCNNLTESDLCDICSDSSRNKEILCVVDSPKNVILFDNVQVPSGTKVQIYSWDDELKLIPRSEVIKL